MYRVWHVKEGPPTSRVYSWTLALRCARRLIKAATTSFALQPPNHELAVPSPGTSYEGEEDRTRCRWRQLCRKHPAQVVSVLGHACVRARGRGRTSMYSQFSLVRFSSVARTAPRKLHRQRVHSSIEGRGRAGGRRRAVVRSPACRGGAREAAATHSPTTSSNWFACARNMVDRSASRCRKAECAGYRGVKVALRFEVGVRRGLLDWWC